MGTAIDPIIETAIPAGENAPPLLTDETNSPPGTDKFSKEGSSASCKPSFVSEPFTELPHSGSAKTSSDQTSSDQPLTHSKTDGASSVMERKNSIAEDSSAMTIEFLRARLLSERTVSRSAKRQIEELSKKVMELERNLQAEMEKRRLSQIAAEEALTKLEHGGVHLDSLQLDAFVSVFDSGDRALSCQDMNTTNSLHSECVMNASGRPSQREPDEPDDRHNYVNVSDVGQASSTDSKPNPVNLESEKDKDEEKEDRPSSTESQSVAPVPVRGIGRSCRTFKKRPTSMDIEEPLASRNGLSKDVACLSQNQDQESEGSDLSGWINCVIDILNHDSKKNFGSSLEDNCTDPEKQGSDTFNFSTQQCPSKEDKFSLNENHKEELNNLDDTSSIQLSVHLVVSDSSPIEEQSDEVKKQHRAELIAWSLSEENEQMLWEQQHPFQSTSEQEQAINNPDCHSCTLETDDSHDTDSFTQKPSKSMSEKPVRVSEGIKELQCVQESPNNLSKQSQSVGLKLQQLTTIEPPAEKNPVDLMSSDNGGRKVPMDLPVSDIKTHASAEFSALDQPATSDSQGNNLHLRHGHRDSEISMEAQLDEDGAFLTCTTEVKYCTDDTEIGEGPQRESAELFTEVFSGHSHSQNNFNNSKYSNNDYSGLDLKGTASEVRLAGDVRADDPCNGVTLKTDLQKQALHDTDFPETFLKGNAAPASRISKETFSKRKARKSEDKGKYLWEPSRPHDPYEAVWHENVAGANYKRSDKALPKDQADSQTHAISSQLSPWKHSNMSKSLYEQAVECKYKAVNPIQREELNLNPYFAPISKHDPFEAHNLHHPSSLEPSGHGPDGKLQNVLRALRLAKEQLKESTEQRQLLLEYSNAKKEDFYWDHSSFHDNYSFGRDMRPSQPLGYSAMGQDQWRLHKQDKMTDFRGFETRLHNYTPAYSPAVIDGFRQYPPAGTQYMPRYGPLSQEPTSSYVDRLNVVKGLDFSFKH